MYVQIYVRELLDFLCRSGANMPIVCVQTKPSKLVNAHVLSLF